MKSKIKENDTIPTVEGDGEVELQVVRGSIIPSSYIDNENEDNTYAIELFSDKMDFVWSVKEPNKEPRVLTDSDIGVLVVDGLNTDTLIVNADNYVERIYTCNIINTLNGEKIESKDQATETNKGSLSFRIV
jgi:ferredoxin-fold anticodon binding domain-containing protein